MLQCLSVRITMGDRSEYALGSLPVREPHEVSLIFIGPLDQH